jgi:S1-C subfamily serine protease
MAGRLGIVLGAGFAAAAGLGAGIALGGAALLGGFSKSTTTVRELQPVQATPSAASFQQGKPLSVNAIYREAAPGVVQVTATQVVSTPSVDPFFGFPVPQSQQQEALGSGFVIDKAGHIITNYHVVEGARSVDVSFSNNESMRARVVGVDPSTDVAVLQVDAHSRALTPLTLGNSDAVRVGDSVVAIGNPFGLERTVTTGIVIQTDAALNKGNSGGPLLDAEGRVIGVNSQIQSGSGGNVGIGFAVPINTVRTVEAQIVKTGHAEHAFLGVRVQAVDANVARLFRLRADHGLLVAGVEPGSAAAKAGLRAGKHPVTVSGETYQLGGDLIVEADGFQLSSLDELRDAIANKQPGDKLTLQIWRGDKQMDLDVKLGRQPSPRG